MDKIYFKDDKSTLILEDKVLSKEKTKLDEDKGYSILLIIGTTVTTILLLLLFMKFFLGKN